jgi:Fe-S oxidoreductase, related to NifB/MoaA family
MAQTVFSVDPGSPAARAGLRPGDRLLTVNGHEILDVLDYRYHCESPRLLLEFLREGKTCRKRIRKEESEPLGLNFETYLMDRPRSCANRCVFCFIDQLPKGMRDTLYFKDDDARLSFLQGNYITLTNLSPREQQRILDLRISPINVSVQATDPEVRRRLLGNPRAGDCYGIMQRFAAGHIQMDCQIVVCPGINDGAVLQRSMEDLAALYPRVSSVSVVPVGLTKHREGLPALTPVDGRIAGEIIDRVDAFGEDCLRRLGSRIFACGDELYRKAGREVPPWDYYEGFPQFENGVGMLRSLEDEFRDALEEKPEAPRPAPFAVATGGAALPLFEKLLQLLRDSCYAVDGRIYGIRNDFFGESVNVAGLITGRDLMAQLRGRPLGERLLVSVSMLRYGGDVFLDDVSLDQVQEALGVPVIPVANDGGAVLRAFLDLK